MSDRLYDILKYIAQIVLPAAGTLYAALAALWGWPYAEAIVGTISALDVFLGALLAYKSRKYYKQLEESFKGYMFDEDELLK